MIVARAPGKLFIAGEYAVLTPGEPSVLIAVDRFIEASIELAQETGTVYSPAIQKTPIHYGRDSQQRFQLEGQEWDFVVQAVRVVEELIVHRGAQVKEFNLQIKSGLIETDGRKLGLGSSGAVLSATIAAIARLNGLSLTRLERFKLAYVAALRVTPYGSGGDLAASTFGGWIRYHSPSGAWVEQSLKTWSIARLLEESWPHLLVEPLPAPQSIEVVVGWTGSPASTPELVQASQKQLAEHDRDVFLSRNRAAVARLIEGIVSDDSARIQSAIRDTRELLQWFGTLSGIEIETDRLHRLCDIAENLGAAAKVSGAGGGDCGIVLAGQPNMDEALERAWRKTGISRIPLSVYSLEEDVHASE